ncbi:shikimate dehydrogenase [Cryobacterium sp. PAMC25264]|uniref:shikimate dehydrogenase family protein n=1 Tax=Cryobacterium sp. PAMC25264 TaxID=2861288 RepID=UPI0021081FEE|nr:shikimate dehydrogenase [Cryobacterium sp. PAMC25264]
MSTPNMADLSGTDPDTTTPSGRRRLAVLGSPIGHSLSPALHQAAYRALGLDWEYTAIEVGAGQVGARELNTFLDGLGPDWLGLSLTMPLKHVIQHRLTDLDRVAAVTGAVNTVRLSDTPGQGRTLSGYNTDVPGLVRALAEAGVDRANRVTLLGAGATAASALVAAAELGAEFVDVIARTPGKAETLETLGRELGLVVTVTGLDAVDAADRESDLVISTLPGGTALPTEFPTRLRAETPLFDVGYAPWPSALASSWAATGGTAYSGLTMLLHQALIQVRIFVANDPFQPLPDEDSVLSAMRAALPAASPGPAVEG